MDGVDEPCSPTPPTGHQHQSGHLMCYEGRTSSRALDSFILGADPSYLFGGCERLRGCGDRRLTFGGVIASGMVGAVLKSSNTVWSSARSAGPGGACARRRSPYNVAASECRTGNGPPRAFASTQNAIVSSSGATMIPKPAWNGPASNRRMPSTAPSGAD